MQNCELIVIGSGIGGLTAASLLARYDKQLLVTESHAITGGVALPLILAPRSTAASATRVASIRCGRFSMFLPKN